MTYPPVRMPVLEVRRATAKMPQRLERAVANAGAIQNSDRIPAASHATQALIAQSDCQVSSRVAGRLAVPPRLRVGISLRDDYPPAYRLDRYEVTVPRTRPSPLLRPEPMVIISSCRSASKRLRAVNCQSSKFVSRRFASNLPPTSTCRSNKARGTDPPVKRSMPTPLRASKVGSWTGQGVGVTNAKNVRQISVNQTTRHAAHESAYLADVASSSLPPRERNPQPWACCSAATGIGMSVLSDHSREYICYLAARYGQSVSKWLRNTPLRDVPGK